MAEERPLRDIASRYFCTMPLDGHVSSRAPMPFRLGEGAIADDARSLPLVAQSTPPIAANGPHAGPPHFSARRVQSSWAARLNMRRTASPLIDDMIHARPLLFGDFVLLAARRDFGAGLDAGWIFFSAERARRHSAGAMRRVAARRFRSAAFSASKYATSGLMLN